MKFFTVVFWSSSEANPQPKATKSLYSPNKNMVVSEGEL